LNLQNPVLSCKSTCQTGPRNSYWSSKSAWLLYSSCFHPIRYNQNPYDIPTCFDS